MGARHPPVVDFSHGVVYGRSTSVEGLKRVYHLPLKIIQQLWILSRE